MGMKKKYPKNKTAQEIQDDIFKKMSADRKIKLALDLSKFCLKLNKLNGNRKTPYQNNSGFRKS